MFAIEPVHDIRFQRGWQGTNFLVVTRGNAPQYRTPACGPGSSASTPRWRLVWVAREEGTFDDVPSHLGKTKRSAAFERANFPEAMIIARLAWSYEASEQNNKVFGRSQSYEAGHPKNGVQFMIKAPRSTRQRRMGLPVCGKMQIGYPQVR